MWVTPMLTIWLYGLIISTGIFSFLLWKFYKPDDK